MKNNILGTEKVGKLLRMFAIPCVMSLIIQSLYNLVDQVYIGHCASLGAIGNAATGIVYPLTIIALGIGLWLGDGSAACISLSQGRKDTKTTSKNVGTALFVGVCISIFLSGICLIFKNNILSAIGGSGKILDFASSYANFILCGFLFFIMACVINPIIRADGSPKYAMLAMAIGAIINIGLDPIFIYGLNMGMKGAALATFLGQMITFALHVAYLFRTRTFKLHMSDLIPNGKEIGKILKFGISSFLTQFAIVVISIVNNTLLLKYSLSSGFDTNITQGVITLAFKVFGIVVSIVVGIASGGQPIIGYNYGAKKYDRVTKALKYMLISTLIVGFVSTVIFEFTPGVFLYIFGNGGEGVDPVIYKNFTYLTFRIYLGFILFTCFVKVISIFFQSIGSPVKATIISMARDMLFLIPGAIILAHLGGVKLLLWSAPISDILSLVLASVLVVIAIKKMKKSNIEKNDEAYIKDTKPGVIFTIAREHGACGRQIGKALADYLGIPYYDKDITLMVAQETGLSSEYIDSVNDGNIALLSDLFVGLNPNEKAISVQRKILEEIAKKGSSVIVGRGADDVLKDYNLFRIFIYAKKEYKIKKIMEKYNDDLINAENNMYKSDKKRAKYYELVTNKKWGDYRNYDILIDGSIGVEKTMNVIAKYYQETNI